MSQMTFAYADPPYVGQAKKHYQCEEIRHEWLIDMLCSQYADGWVLSASSPSLKVLLPLCPKDIRVGAWVKPFAAFKRNVNPAYTWEPVIFRGGRKKSGVGIPTVKDHVIESITLRKGLVGAKPARFCNWILDLLGSEPGDILVDVYPGTGIMGQVARERLLFGGPLEAIIQNGERPVEEAPHGANEGTTLMDISTTGDPH